MLVITDYGTGDYRLAFTNDMAMLIILATYG